MAGRSDVRSPAAPAGVGPTPQLLARKRQAWRVPGTTLGGGDIGETYTTVTAARHRGPGGLGHRPCGGSGAGQPGDVHDPYWHSDRIKLAFGATDTPAGVRSISARIDGNVVVRSGQTLDMRTLRLGSHSLKVTATDRAGNTTTETVTFRVKATVKSMIRSVNLSYSEHKITRLSLKTRLVSLLNAAEYYRTHSQYRRATLMLSAFNVTVATESGRHIVSGAARVLMDDASYVMANIRK